uniref:Uncharacterized protein n=1 Tax=Physcomitrium patens TaxID=3218 RepID=A0A2K1L6X8_PHYPA|nr:hypothetical protein PHYPA_000224 [Physcomitrium patens]
MDEASQQRWLLALEEGAVAVTELGREGVGEGNGVEGTRERRRGAGGPDLLDDSLIHHDDEDCCRLLSHDDSHFEAHHDSHPIPLPRPPLPLSKSTTPLAPLS